MWNEVKISGFADEIDSSLNRQIAVLKKLNMNYVEMRGVNGKSLVEYPICEVKEIKKKLEDNQIMLSAVGSPLGKIGIQDDFQKHMEFFKHTVEIANIMEAPYIRLFSFYIPDGQYADCRQEVMERMGTFIDCVSQNSDNVILLHENEKGIYGDQAERCLDLMKVHYGKRFQGIFDFANFVQCKQDTLQAYQILAPYITYFHMKDAMESDGKVVPVGMGDGHVKEILMLMKEKGYDGFLSLEPHLSDFAGFSSLEQDQNQLSHKLSGEETFTIAYNALMKLIG